MGKAPMGLEIVIISGVSTRLQRGPQRKRKLTIERHKYGIGCERKREEKQSSPCFSSHRGHNLKARAPSTPLWTKPLGMKMVKTLASRSKIVRYVDVAPRVNN
jgi:hypothetical protein